MGSGYFENRVMENDFLGSPTDENSIHNWTLGKEIFEKYKGIENCGRFNFMKNTYMFYQKVILRAFHLCIPI